MLAYRLYSCIFCLTLAIAFPQHILTTNQNLESYIIVFKDGVSKEQRELHIEGCKDNFIDSFSIGGEFNGYFAYLNDFEVHLTANNPLVEIVEPNTVGRLTEYDTQEDSTWALSSISHRGIEEKYEYLYDNQGGKGVTAYIIDTGVKESHPEFGGRVEWVEVPPTFHSIKKDIIGHGTHVAGIVGSKTYGVAKKVRIKAINIFTTKFYSPDKSDFVRAIQYAVDDHLKVLKSKPKGFKGAVMNLSIGFEVSFTLDAAVKAAANAGIHISISAGNDADDACNVSPARLKYALTVGSINSENTMSDYSNFGSCVDIFAPGEKVKSTSNWSYFATHSGTSLAAPHVTGLLAYFLSLYPDSESEYAIDLSPDKLRSIVLKHATKGVISDLEGDTVNLLAYNGGHNLTLPLY